MSCIIAESAEGGSAWLAAGDAAVEDISEIEDNISLMTEEDEEEEGTDAHVNIWLLCGPILTFRIRFPFSARLGPNCANLALI